MTMLGDGCRLVGEWCWFSSKTGLTFRDGFELVSIIVVPSPLVIWLVGDGEFLVDTVNGGLVARAGLAKTA